MTVSSSTDSKQTFVTLALCVTFKPRKDESLRMRVGKLLENACLQSHCMYSRCKNSVLRQFIVNVFKVSFLTNKTFRCYQLSKQGLYFKVITQSMNVLNCLFPEQLKNLMFNQSIK